jgi:hypothetical protein
MKKVGMAIWNILRPLVYILWPFGNLVTIWYIFPRSGVINKKIWQPWFNARKLQEPESFDWAHETAFFPPESQVFSSNNSQPGDRNRKSSRPCCFSRTPTIGWVLRVLRPNVKYNM